MSKIDVPTVVLVSGGAGCQGHGRGYLRHLATEIQATGQYRVAVVVPRSTGLDAELENAGVAVHTVEADFAATHADRFRKFGRAAGVARGFTRLALNHRFLQQAADIACGYGRAGSPSVCHFLDYEYISLVACLKTLQRQGCKTVVTMHPSDFSPSGFSAAATYKRVVRRLLTYVAADAYFCHGRWIAERLRTQLRLSPDKIHHFPYPALQSAQKLPRQEARRALELPHGVTRWLLWYGMIRRNKRVDVAIDAVAELPESYGLLVVGNPADVSREEVLDRVKSRGLERRVHLELRYVDDAELPTWFGAADLLLATHDASFTSASGPVADARAYGLPAVVSDVGELSNYVKTYGVGRVASAEDPLDFARAVRGLFADDDELARCQNALVKAAEELSWTAFARQHAKMYDQALSRVDARDSRDQPEEWHAA